jgi:ribonuclease HI
MKHVDIYTDGACRGNPGRGGWGAILVYGGVEKELSGGERETTNNRMELTAVIAALSALRESCEVTLTSDSKYVIDAVTKGWAVSWRQKGWRKADKSPALNVDLWEQLLALLEKHKVSFVWVRGHNGHPYNERCDELATTFADSFADS